jgi:hypothetical protein
MRTKVNHNDYCNNYLIHALSISSIISLQYCIWSYRKQHFYDNSTYFYDHGHYIYSSFKNGNITYQCTLGGSAIQIAECQFLQSLNYIVLQLTVQFMEFLSKLFDVKNLVDTSSRLFTVIAIGKYISCVIMLNMLKVYCLYYSLIYYLTTSIIVYLFSQQNYLN